MYFCGITEHSSWTLTDSSRFSALHFLRHMWLFFARRSDFLKEIRRRGAEGGDSPPSGSDCSCFADYCGAVRRRHRVSSNHLYKRWRAESAERDPVALFTCVYVSPCGQRPLSRSVLLCGLLAALYKARLKCGAQVAWVLQAKPSRSGKQEQ